MKKKDKNVLEAIKLLNEKGFKVILTLTDEQVEYTANKVWDIAKKDKAYRFDETSIKQGVMVGAKTILQREILLT